MPGFDTLSLNKYWHSIQQYVEAWQQKHKIIYYKLHYNYHLSNQYHGVADLWQVVQWFKWLIGAEQMTNHCRNRLPLYALNCFAETYKYIHISIISPHWDGTIIMTHLSYIVNTMAADKQTTLSTNNKCMTVSLPIHSKIEKHFTRDTVDFG